MHSPVPVRSRRKRAATIAKAANMPPAMSATATPIRSGGRPGSPVIPWRPPIPWRMRSYAGHSR